MSATAGLRLSVDDLATIAHRARSLDEVLAEPRSGAGSTMAAPPPAWLPPGAFERWSRAFAPGDHAAFVRRLAWDGLSEAAVRAALHAAESAEDIAVEAAALPTWAERLGAALRAVAGSAGASSATEVAGATVGEPRPFAELWLPFVRHARAEAIASAGAAGRHLAPGATASLERHLLAQLTELSALALYARFDGVRTRAAAVLPREPAPGTVPARRVYERLVADLLAGEIVPFFTEHGALARQVVRFLETWSAGTSEFLRRLDADLPAIGRDFAAGAEPGPVVDVEAGLSDRHDGGRRVLAIRFAGGLRLIYKPRDIGLEVAFGSFLERLAAAGLDPAPAPLRALPRAGYGWVEFVAQAPAADLDEVRAYYRRAGALLVIAFLLGGRDLHMENVVAGRGGPFLVDVETLLQPGRAGSGEGRPAGGAVARAQAALGDSFLATGLLTFEEAAAGGTIRDVGGLCGRGGWTLGARRLAWVAANTDAMRPEPQAACAPERANVLYAGGEVQPPERFAGELAEGFEAGYRFLLARREALLAPDGPLAAFAGLRTRLILRPTNLYATLQVRLAAPAYQRDGLARSFAIDALNRVFRHSSERPLLWPLAEDERRALENLDVPHFSVATDSTVIVSGRGERITGVLARSGVDEVRSRLARLGSGDLARQLELLRASLAMAEGAAHGQTTGAAAPAGAGDPMSQAALIAAARALAEEIRSHAVRGDDGSVMWVLPAHLRQAGRSDRGVAYYLYHGISGVGLFLAALARVTGERSWAELARGAFRTIGSALAGGPADALLRHEGIGACNGLGGVVYALACAARLLGDDDCTELATRVASCVTLERIGGDERLDVEGGAAGAALGLLALHDLTGEGWLVERAAACGERLLATQVPAPAGGAAWPGADGLTRAGFAHGATGMAHALLRVYQVTGQVRFREAAREAHAFERTVYSPGQRNWPVPVRGPDGSVTRVTMTAWCHGAPGIALARALEMESPADEATAAELETALATTAAAGLLDADHLCCGNMSLIDILITAWQTLGRPELHRGAEALGRAVVERARGDGGFRLSFDASGSRIFQPGLFRGGAGVGYGLLRLARPEDVPCVLAFRPAPSTER